MALGVAFGCTAHSTPACPWMDAAHRSLLYFRLVEIPREMPSGGWARGAHLVSPSRLRRTRLLCHSTHGQVQENTLIVCHASRNDIILGCDRDMARDSLKWADRRHVGAAAARQSGVEWSGVDRRGLAAGTSRRMPLSTSRGARQVHHARAPHDEGEGQCLEGRTHSDGHAAAGAAR